MCFEVFCGCHACHGRQPGVGPGGGHLRPGPPGALTLVQAAPLWTTQTQASGLWNFEVFFAGTNANNVASPTSTPILRSGRERHGPGWHVGDYQRGRHLHADPVNGFNGNGWSGSSYSGVGIDNNMTFLGPTTNGRFTLPVGTYLLATLPAGLTAADFGNTFEGNAGDAEGSVVYADGFGATTNDIVTIVDLQQVPEPCTLVGMFGASVVGLVGFGVRRLRKVAV